MTEEGISSKLDRMINLLEKDKEQKKFKFPLFSRVSNAKRKRGWVITIILRTNGNAEFKKLRITDNVIKVPSLDGDSPTYHEATVDEVFYYKRFPVLIVAEWDMKPVSKTSLMKSAQDNNSLTFAEKYIYAKMRRDMIKGVGASLGKVVIVILVIGGLLLAGNYFGLFGG